MSPWRDTWCRRATAPGALLGGYQITGRQPGDRLMGIDFRPATREAFAVGDSRFVYRLNVDRGEVTQVGAGLTPTPNQPLSSFTRDGIGINPTVDRIRVVGVNAFNRRLNPIYGASGLTHGSPVNTALIDNPPSTALIAP